MIIGFYTYFFLFINKIQIELIALVNVFSVLIPFLINCIILVITFLSLKNTKEEGLRYRVIIKEIMNYGSFITIQSLISRFWNEIKTQSIGIFISPNYVLGYTISKRYSEVSTLFIQALNDPFIVTLSTLEPEKDFKAISKIFQVSFKYTFFFISLIIGILIFLSNFFLFFVYGESYLIFSPLLILFLISIIFNPLGAIFMIFLKSLNKVKIMPLLELGVTILRVSTFYTGLIFFGIYGMMIGIIINRFLIFMIYCYLSRKILRIKINYLTPLKQVFIFLISLILPVSLGYFFLNDLYYSLLLMIGAPSFLKYFNIINLIFFLICFFSLNFIFKIITKKDIEYIESLFIREKFTYKLMRRLLKQIKRLTR